MQHRNIVSDVSNGLDFTDEGRTAQQAAEQLVVRLDYPIAPVRARSVERDVITGRCETGAVRLCVAVRPRLAQPLEQDAELLVVDSLRSGICGGLRVGHMSI